MSQKLDQAFEAWRRQAMDDPPMNAIYAAYCAATERAIEIVDSCAVVHGGGAVNQCCEDIRRQLEGMKCQTL